MGIEAFIVGFALLVVGLALGFLVKVRFGWLVIVGCTVILGTFGFGYLVGRANSKHDASEAIRNLLATDPGGNQLIVDGWLFKLSGALETLDPSFWLFLVSVFMLFCGLSAFIALLKIEFSRTRRAGELGVPPDKVKVDVTFG